MKGKMPSSGGDKRAVVTPASVCAADSKPLSKPWYLWNNPT